jgi:hypothetical protein
MTRANAKTSTEKENHEQQKKEDLDDPSDDTVEPGRFHKRRFTWSGVLYVNDFDRHLVDIDLANAHR